MRPVATAFVGLALALPLHAQQPAAPIQRLLPDLSVVGDIVADLSPDSSTQEDGARFTVRHVELAAQAAVDPYFRGDVFLGFSDAEGVEVEQAFLTTTAFPWALEVRLGKQLMPVGKLNVLHRHDLHTIEYPYVLQRFLGEEGLKGTGVYVSRVFAPLGFYQEVQLAAVDGLGEAPEEFEPIRSPTEDLDGLGYSGRLRSYWDLSESANLEISGSALTALRPQPLLLDGETSDLGVNARQTLVGGDVTFRWRPLAQGLYRSFILQVELLHQINSEPDLAGVPSAYDYGGPLDDYSGAYAFARWQVTRRGYVGSRFDWLQDVELDGADLRAVSGYYEFFPSEFSKLLVAYERVLPEDGDGVNRILLQAAFALGPHRPHPF
jgi:hypothetical protein